MANNYLSFSEVLPQLTESEETWLKLQLEIVYAFGDQEYAEGSVPEELYPEDADWHGCRAYRNLEGFDPEIDGESVGFEYAFHDDRDSPDGWGRHLWIYAEEGADLERVAHLARKFLSTFRPRDSWSLTYSLSCSKPRAGEFGGGGIFITAKNIKWFDAYSLVAKEHAAFQRRRGAHSVTATKEKG